MAYAELHCHSNFSFLDGASAPDELTERAAELGVSALAATDHQGLYGAVRFATAAEAAGIHPVVGVEIELLDAIVPDPAGVVIPARRPVRRRRRAPVDPEPGAGAVEGVPDRPRPERDRLPGHRDAVKEDHRGIGTRQRGPHLVLLARDATGWRSLCRLISRANLAGTKAAPRFLEGSLAEHAEGVVALSGCREGEIARRLRVGDRAGARAAAAALAERYPGGFHVELSHHLLPDDDWLVTESVALARDLRLPVVVTNDVHYARREGREFHDVLTAIRHGRTLDTLADLRRPDGESHLKSEAEMLALPPGTGSLGRDVARAWAEGIEGAAALAAACSVDLGFEQYRFPGFPVPAGETPFSYLSELCWAGARKRYHPLTSAVVKRLAHELEVIERAGLAEFFLICWDLMRFAKEHGIPAQGRGSATSSIVSYTLGISRVEPIAHNLLFERFINEGRTTYPDVDIDFSSERREEVIQYVYGRYGPEHTGMVCNLVTYRARSAVREVGYALGFPRPLVDRVAKALETYDSVMVRRDLEADGGFAEFFRRPGEGLPAEAAGGRGAESRGFVDGMGQLNKRVPLVGKVPPWRQPPKPADPNAPQPFAWLREASADSAAISGAVSPGAVYPGAGRPTRPPRRRRLLRGRNLPPRLPRPQAPVQPVAAKLALGRRVRRAPGCGKERRSRRRRSGRADGTTTRAVPGDTPASVAWLRAGRGTGYAADREQAACRRRSSRAARSIRRAACPSRAPRQTDRLGRPNHWDPPAPRTGRWAGAGAAPRSPAWSLSPRPSRSADRRGTSPTGTAGSSSVPGSTASPATSRSTRAACS